MPVPPASPRSRALERASTDTRGILNPGARGERFQLERFEPAGELRCVVERYWCVRWELAPDDSYLTETLPFPSVNVVFEGDAASVNGICTRRWSRVLRGAGRVFGVKFQPGAFAAFFGRPIRELTDRVLPLSDVFGEEARALEARLLAEPRDSERASIFEAFLRPRLPPPDPERERVLQIVNMAIASPGLNRVEQLAHAAAVPTRSLQRLFQRYLGVTPKWMLCRFRMQEAAQRVAAGEPVDWAALAAELGYFDQAHFAGDFKAQLGKTPSEYAALTGAPTRPA
jgi:AraC-like DNA-binding protein